MTVRELIDRLQHLPEERQDLQVYMGDDDQPDVRPVVVVTVGANPGVPGVIIVLESLKAK